MSKFEEATGGKKNVPAMPENDEMAEQTAFVPRAVYTSDAKLDPTKLNIPRLRVAQGMTPEVMERSAQIGDFVLTNYPAKSEVLLVPFAAQNIRYLKPDPRQPPVCQAPTGDVGIGDPGGPCVACPYSKWGARDPRTGKSTPPPCTEAVSVRAFSLTHRTMVDFVFDGRRAGKGAFIQQQGLAFGMGQFVVKMTTSPVSNNFGTWAEPNVQMMGTVEENVSDEKLLDLTHTWFQLHNAMLTTTEEAKRELLG